MKVAIVHDWLTGMRGGEKVLEVLCDIFPEAVIYTLFCDERKISHKIKKMKLVTSFLQNLPFSTRLFRRYLPLFPLAVEQFDLTGYELVISSSHCVAKGVVTGADCLHISYCYTPLRYGWDMYQEYFAAERLTFPEKALIPVFLNYLRMWDVVSSSRVDYFAAISNTVRNRIKKHYRRDSVVIYPPVDTSFFTPGEKTSAQGSGSPINRATTSDGEGAYLIVSSLSPYKRIDVAIEAFNRLGRPLRIVGLGPELRRLKRLAGKNIEFLGWVEPAVLRDLYRGCRALVFPGEEDFGIAPVEAMASGKPVIGYGRGGLTETVSDGATGIHFSPSSPPALCEAVRSLETISFDPELIRKSALRFDTGVFRNHLKKFIDERFNEWTERASSASS